MNSTVITIQVVGREEDFTVDIKTILVIELLVVSDNSVSSLLHKKLLKVSQHYVTPLLHSQY